jgi:hypothetical protein
MLLWKLSPSLESLKYFLDLEDEERFEFVNRDALFRHWDRFSGSEYDAYGDDERELLEFDAMPVPIFRIADSAFKLDYFGKSKIECASLHLRQALDLTKGVIRYRDIDTDQSPPAVRAQEYQAFQVVPVADPIDWSRTPGQLLEYQRADGSIRKQWILAIPNPVDGSPRVHWREDFVPPAPLFRVFRTHFVLATDALAERVMRAGITDLVFQDIISDRAQTELVLRQP